MLTLYQDSYLPRRLDLCFVLVILLRNGVSGSSGKIQIKAQTRQKLNASLRRIWCALTQPAEKLGEPTFYLLTMDSSPPYGDTSLLRIRSANPHLSHHSVL